MREIFAATIVPITVMMTGMGDLEIPDFNDDLGLRVCSANIGLGPS